MKKLLSLLLVGVMSVMLLAGCGTTGGGQDNPDSGSDETEKSISIAQSANFSMGFAPGVQSYETTYYTNNFYESLVEYRDGEYQPCLATDWTVSEDGLMRAGEVDFIIGSDTLDANSYQELSQTEGITGIISDFNFVTEFIALNDEIAPLDDQNVRTAIQMAIDKESIAQNIYAGLRTAANSVMPTDMPYCDATVTTPDYDMAGAIALLEDSGWVDSDGDGIREKDGKVLSFTITYPSTGVYDNVVLFFQSAMEELGIEIKTNPIDLMAFMQQVFMEDNYEMTAYMSYWFPYDPYTFVANMYPSTDYSDPSGIYSTDPQVAKALASMSDEEAKALIAGLYNTDDPAVVQEIFTEALNSANESSVIIPLNYRNEYAVFNSDVIESYTFNSIPNHVDVAAIQLK